MHHAYVPPGKKQLNQLITFLDKGGNAKESRAGDALRTVRAKREADDAGQWDVSFVVCARLTLRCRQGVP